MTVATVDIQSGPVARATDPDTSHGAGEQATKEVSESCGYVLQLMYLIGRTGDETLQAYYDVQAPKMGWPAQRCVRKRRCDLVKAGLVRATGSKVKNSVGISVKEWEAV